MIQKVFYFYLFKSLLGKRKFKSILYTTVKDFGKKITQLCAIEEIDMLISICDGYTKIHTLKRFKEIEILSIKV